MTNHYQVKVKITGIVQGVFFRLETQKTANRYGVKGYVKNLPDGSVEAVFQGQKEQVDQVLAWCQHGPDTSRVDHMHQEELVNPTGQLISFESFDVRYE